MRKSLILVEAGQEFKDARIDIELSQIRLHRPQLTLALPLNFSESKTSDTRFSLSVNLWNRVLSVLTSMPFEGTSSGGKCYGAGRRRLSPGSFQKGLENRERTEEKWNQQHGRSFAKKPIHEAWERLKRSRSCESFFVDVLLEQADLYSLVFFLDIQTFYQILFAQVYSVRLTPIYLFLAIRQFCKYDKDKVYQKHFYHNICTSAYSGLL